MNKLISSTKLITHYGRIGELQEAMRIFDEMPNRNQISWNAMLTVFLDFGRLDSARKLFDEMPERNSVSHTLMIAGFSRFGFVPEARQVFDSIPFSNFNVFSWTAMISCYAHNRQPFQALKLFSGLYGDFFNIRIIPNSFTFSTLLKACAEMQSLVTAGHIHALLVKLLDEECEGTVYVQNSLIDLNAKFGCLVDAEKIFNRLKWKDLSSWNIMMAAYTRCLYIDKALGLFDSMKEKDTLSWNIIISGLAESGSGEGALNLFISLLRLWPETKPNPSTYTVVLTVCATITALKFGRQIHSQTIKLGLDRSNIFIGNSLITMYARGSFIEESELVFSGMLKKDVISWNSLILGLGENGYAIKALEVAEKALKLEAFNQNTFIGILTTCSHGGLIDEGMKYFSSMSRKYAILPGLDHYICVIDMLGRAGRITEAHDFLCKMPLKANSVAWAALLNACLIHENREVGEIAAREVRTLEPDNATSYVMLASICGKTGRTDERRKLLNLMREKGLKKEPGYSLIVEI
ncbi:pentatricopeptide repeat-containing protein At2g13600-like [Tasmannia lanceolata]|uniref:pentatricopeptide repeat-containing protein At2g13600-like n=1 Tax=Tasmannia lanceolata TaxID=3420 RepID=UPI004062DE3D